MIWNLINKIVDRQIPLTGHDNRFYIIFINIEFYDGIRLVESDKVGKPAVPLNIGSNRYKQVDDSH